LFRASIRLLVPVETTFNGFAFAKQRNRFSLHERDGSDENCEPTRQAELKDDRTWMPALGHSGRLYPEQRYRGRSGAPSHEAACVLNAGDSDAQLTIMLYFENRKPAGPYHVIVGARRTVHLRFNDLSDPEPVPRDTSYASLITSTQPVVVQHTRLDSSGSRIALLSTIAFPQG
jgi:hypothetical protein